MKPACPHCDQEFETWAFAKRHVKYCEKGPNPRKRIEDRDERLYCAYCAESGPSTISLMKNGTYGFKDFKDLGRHVLEEHVLPFAPSARAKEVERMLKSNLYKEQQMKLNPNTVNGHTQLLPSMLVNLGDEAIIAGFREAGATYQYSDYILDLKFGKSIYEFPFQQKNEDFRSLASSLGLDTDKWNGKKLKLSTEEYTSTRTGKVSDIIRFELAK